MDDQPHDRNGQLLYPGQRVEILDLQDLSPHVHWNETALSMIGHRLLINRIGEPLAVPSLDGLASRPASHRHTWHILRFLGPYDDEPVWIYSWLVAVPSTGLRGLVQRYHQEQLNGIPFSLTDVKL